MTYKIKVQKDKTQLPEFDSGLFSLQTFKSGEIKRRYPGSVSPDFVYYSTKIEHNLKYIPITYCYLKGADDYIRPVGFLFYYPPGSETTTVSSKVVTEKEITITIRPFAVQYPPGTVLPFDFTIYYFILNQPIMLGRNPADEVHIDYTKGA